jgi:transposase
LLGAGGFWGARTGPNPTDRGKAGSKRHLLTDAAGLPLAIEHTGANVHDSKLCLPLVEAIPPIQGPRGRPRRRPEILFADRAYDSKTIRQALRACGILPAIAKRGEPHGSGLGVYRCVVEGPFAWLFGWRRLRARYEKRADIHDAFLRLACAMICFRRWHRNAGFC